MSRTSLNGCSDSGDLAGMLPDTDAVCSRHGTIPITMRQELHMKREKNTKVWIRDRRKELPAPGTCCFLLNGTNIQDLCFLNFRCLVLLKIP